jgi:uncharacterized membrane protein
MIHYAPLALIILSSTLYHLSQKATPPNAHPLLTLAVSYAAATLVCVAALPLIPLQGGLAEAVRKLNWTSLLLALAITGIEVGFLLAYRAGWKISQAALIANTSVALLLVPIGILGFAEKFSINHIIGVSLCIAGLILLNTR